MVNALPLTEIAPATGFPGHENDHLALNYWLNRALIKSGRLLAKSFDPKYGSSTGTPTIGVAMATRIEVPAPILVTNIETVVGTAPTGTAQANCFLGLYDVNTLAELAATADASTLLGSAGRVVVPLTAPVTLPGTVGYSVYAVVVVGTAAGTTAMQLVRSVGSGNSSTMNFDYTSPQFAAAVGGSGLSALPGTLPSLSAGGSVFLFGLS